MDRIYNDAVDKNVSCVVVYAKTNGSIYYDAETKNAVPAEDCLNLFLKGVVAVKAGTYYAAKSCTSAGVIDFGFAS